MQLQALVPLGIGQHKLLQKLSQAARQLRKDQMKDSKINAAWGAKLAATKPSEVGSLGTSSTSRSFTSPGEDGPSSGA